MFVPLGREGIPYLPVNILETWTSSSSSVCIQSDHRCMKSHLKYEPRGMGGQSQISILKSCFPCGKLVMHSSHLITYKIYT